MSPGRDSSPKRPGSRGWLIGLVLLASLLLNALPLWWGLPTDQSWAYDEITPGQVRGLFKWPVKYPPLHRYVLKALYGPVMGLQQAGILSLGDFDLDTVLFVLGRSVSVLLATSTVYLVYRCGRELGGRLAACFAAAVAAAVPPFVYYAKTANLEAPYVFWFALSVLFFLKILRRHRMRHYLAFGVSAALAICTKDQAYGLYLLSPLPMVLGLARADGGGAKAFFAALVDRRLLAMAATAVVVFVSIHQIPWHLESFAGHVEAMIGPASVKYRIYPMTPEGHARMGLQSLRHLVFGLGAPFFMAAAGGLALALRRRRGWRLLALMLLAASYYLSFISVIGYNYVRFFIPVCLLLALPAGAALAELVRRRGPAVGLRRALVAAAVLHALLRAASVDLWMFGDARYSVERWLEAKGARDAAVGIGTPRMLPRGIQVVDWNKFDRNECLTLSKLNARHIVIDPAAGRDPRTFGRFITGELNYAVAAKLRRPSFSLLDISGLHTNLDKISREMLILERIDGECLDLAGVVQAMGELQHSADPQARSRLTAAILNQGIALKKNLDESMAVVGLSPDRWTYGVRPAGLAVRNRSHLERTPRLRVRAGGRDEDFPATVWVDDGHGARSHRVEQPSGGEIELTAVPPGEERLFLLWADKAWSLESRRFGLRIFSGEWLEEGQ